MESHIPDPATSPLFVVDDDPTVMDSLRRLLARLGYPVRGFVDPAEAIRALEEEPVHLLITDKEMAHIDGIELARRALEADPNTVVLMLTGKGDVDSAAEALRLGLVDYLLKPVDVGVLEVAVRKALMNRAQAIFHRELHGRLREEVEAKTAELERQWRLLDELTVAALSALVGLLEARSPHFRGHSEAVSALAERIAKTLKLPPEEVEHVRIAGLLHDIGMVAVPDGLVDKGDRLTPEEFRSVVEHGRLAGELLRPFANLGGVADYVMHHHERIDGSGYPDGLRGHEIPLGAQIVGAADAYVALVESRAFRDAVSPEEALETLRGTEGTWFTSRVLDALETASRQEEGATP